MPRMLPPVHDGRMKKPPAILSTDQITCNCFSRRPHFHPLLRRVLSARNPEAVHAVQPGCPCLPHSARREAMGFANPAFVQCAALAALLLIPVTRAAAQNATDNADNPI